MAAIPVILDGTSTADDGSSQHIKFDGTMSYSGLAIGGGPIIPPDQPPQGPPGIPTFPIWGPPGITLPPGSGYPPVAGHPLPPIPDQPPEQPPGSGPIAGWNAKALWTAETGWVVILVPAEDTLVPTPSRRR